MKIPNHTVINGIEYIDSQHVNIADQEPCPLVEQGIQHLCINEYRDHRLRSESCEHKEFCQGIRDLHKSTK